LEVLSHDGRVHLPSCRELFLEGLKKGTMILKVQDARMRLRGIGIPRLRDDGDDEWLLARCIKLACEALPGRRAQLVTEDENAATAKLNFVSCGHF
jgi:hypothetical protein